MNAKNRIKTINFIQLKWANPQPFIWENKPFWHKPQGHLFNNPTCESKQKATEGKMSEWLVPIKESNYNCLFLLSNDWFGSDEVDDGILKNLNYINQLYQ